jgi:hypothetical protein
VGGVNTTNLVFRSSQPRAQVEDLVARDHNLLVLFEREEAKGVASGKRYHISERDYYRIENT